MRRYWILVSLGALLIGVALAIGLTPVHGSLVIGFEPSSISCGSSLIKRAPVDSVSPARLPFVGSDPCSLARDHRRLPVKILGGAGAVLLAAASLEALLTGRRESAEGGRRP